MSAATRSPEIASESGVSAPKLPRCEICGREVERASTGRPRESCSDACKRINGLLSRLETALTEIDLSTWNERRMRSRLWYLANLLNGR